VACKVVTEGATARNIARTCRHFGISRQAFYRWKRRFDADGEAALWDLAGLNSLNLSIASTISPSEIVSRESD
jgi:transposase-like protein